MMLFSISFAKPNLLNRYSYLLLLGILILSPTSTAFASEIYKIYEFPDTKDTGSFQIINLEIPKLLEAKLQFWKKGDELGAYLTFLENRKDYLAVSAIIVLYDEKDRVISAVRYPFIYSKCSEFIFADGKPLRLGFEFGPVKNVDHYLLSYSAVPDKLGGVSCDIK